MRSFREFLTEESGIGVVEMILILVVLIGLVVIFRDKLTDLVETILNNIARDAKNV